VSRLPGRGRVGRSAPHGGLPAPAGEAMSYQPFSRADRNRWRRNEAPRRALYLTEWHGRRFAAWATRNPVCVAVKP